jgi:hypothetical protein
MFLLVAFHRRQIVAPNPPSVAQVVSANSDSISIMVSHQVEAGAQHGEFWLCADYAEIDQQDGMRRNLFVALIDVSLTVVGVDLGEHLLPIR